MKDLKMSSVSISLKEITRENVNTKLQVQRCLHFCHRTDDCVCFRLFSSTFQTYPSLVHTHSIMCVLS